MQGALTDGRMGSTVAAVAKALKPASEGGSQVKGHVASEGGSTSPEKQPAPAAATSSIQLPEKPQLIRAKY